MINNVEWHRTDVKPSIAIKHLMQNHKNVKGAGTHQ